MYTYYTSPCKHTGPPNAHFLVLTVILRILSNVNFTDGLIFTFSINVDVLWGIKFAILFDIYFSLVWPERPTNGDDIIG